MTPFGPQLIGEAEKTLDAILGTLLADTGIDARQWVTLRLAAQANGADLPSFVAGHAHFADAADLVADLTDRGLLDGDSPSQRGTNFIADLQTHISTITAPIWADLPSADVAATERTLNTLIARSRAIISRD